jgi:IS30 family transposase
VERRSRYTLIVKAKSKQADEVSNKTIELMTPVRELVHTITAESAKYLGCVVFIYSLSVYASGRKRTPRSA